MKLGDNISFEKDGVIHTERLEQFHYASGSPAIYRDLNRWQQFLRRLTPPRWRKPLLIREAEAPSIIINDDPPNREGIGSVGKTLAQLQQMKAAFDSLSGGFKL